MTLRQPALFILSMLMLSSAAFGRYPADQAVTFTNFSYVRYTAASTAKVYFATTAGILVFNHMQNRWELPLTSTPGLDEQDILQIWVDQFDRNLYARTPDGLFEYDMLLESWFSITEIPEFSNFSKHVSAPQVMHAPPGFTYSADSELIDPWGRYWPVNDVLDDGSGYWWFGFWGFGAARARTSNRILNLMPFGLLQERVNTIWADGDVLFVSGAVFDEPRTGITKMNPDSLEFEFIESGVQPGFPAIDINCIEGDSAYLYIGTPWGLYMLNRSTGYVDRTITKRYGLINENVISLEAVGDSIYIGTAEGLSMVTGQSDSISLVRPTMFSSQRIWDIEGIDGYIWIGSSNGAFRLTPGQDRLQRFQDNENVLFADVYDIQRWGDMLWFVSDAGLVRLNLETGESESFQSAISKIGPRSLAVNDSIAAVSSDQGITVLFHSHEKPFTRDFTTRDGLASNRVYALLMDGDFIWVGTDRGLTQFLWNNPDRVDY